ncbi:MAG TPA: hypothetical protein VGE29_12615 [Prosthecobacter sp.]
MTNPSSPALPLLQDFSDRLSPMVVKELRHGLRARVFTSVLTVFHVCMIVIVSACTVGADVATVGYIFWAFSAAALLVALPLRGFGALCGEMKSGTMDMLSLTSISGMRIVLGKWVALFSQSLLLAVSLLPYMVARYQFGGVEIAQEAAALGLMVILSGVITAAMVTFSSQKSLVLRLLMAAGVLPGVIPATVFIFLLGSTTGGEILSEFRVLEGWQQGGILACVSLGAAYVIYTLLALGASRIAPPSENHSTVKRRVHLAILAIITVIGWCLAEHSEEAMMWALVPSWCITFLVGVDVTTEEMPRFPGVVRDRVKRGGFSLFLGRLFYPGWSSGVMFYILLVGMCVSIMTARWFLFRDLDSVFPMFASLLAGVVVPACVRVNKTNPFANWWVVQIGLGVAGVLLSIVVDVTSERDFAYAGLVVPQMALLAAMSISGTEIFRLMAMSGGVWLLAAFLFSLREGKIYRRLEEEARESLDAGGKAEGRS